ncbi:hypothetical protein [Algoriphagus namhaensis]
MKSKVVKIGSVALLIFGLQFSSYLLQNHGEDYPQTLNSAVAQSLGGDDLGLGGEKTEWFYFDCEYVQGKYCSSVKSDSSCGKSKKKPIGAC